ncbi:MAG: biosynthetic-type acetolactate synthase large subunit [Bdellovibrionales bacterium]|nr:biosynthetic-type acetolactate synthase large subunit [Bdellovibrionales bacterium]
MTASRKPAATEKLSAEISGSYAVLESLVRNGCDTIFGYPGGAIMPIYDALYDYRKKIRHVLVRHEQGATHAAEGYARVTGRAGVCFATSGPGATNLVTGIADAMLDSVPMVCITGQVAAHLLGTDAFQETDIIGVTMPITKWNYQITNAEEIPAIIDKAFQIAEEGRPGPVLIDITKNAQIDMCEYDHTPKPLKSYVWSKPQPKTGDLERAANLINEAKQPMMLIGHGILISHAEEEVRMFAEHTGIPVASTLHGLSAFPTDHPLYTGMLGMHGNYGPNLLTNEADVIIAAGMRFDDRVTGNVSKYAPDAKIIHIDLDAAEIGKNVGTRVGIIADAKEALQGLIPLLLKSEHPEWIARFQACHHEEKEKVLDRDIFPKEGMLKMGEVVRVLSEKTHGEAVVVSDVGQHQMMAARYYRFKKSNSWMSSGGLGTMGFAVPAAMGAQIGAPDRPVVAIVGDGGIQMTIQELGTIAQEQLPVKIVLLNNNYLGMVRQWQELFFDRRYSFVHLENPDFQTISKGFGVPAILVEKREQLSEAMDRMLAMDGPCLLEVRVEQEQNVFPMVPTGASVSEVRLD